MSESELLNAFLGSQSSKHACGLSKVGMRRKAQTVGVMDRLLHEFAGTPRFGGNHGKTGLVMIANTPAVIGRIAVFISGQLCAQTENVDQKNTHLDTRSA